MLYSYLHSSNKKITESLDRWESAMVQPLSVVSAVALLKVTPPRVLFESRSRLFEPNTAGSLESKQKSPDACVLERLRRQRVAKESQSKHPFIFSFKKSQNSAEHMANSRVIHAVQQN